MEGYEADVGLRGGGRKEAWPKGVGPKEAGSAAYPLRQKNRKKPENRKKAEKTGKKREKGSQNIKACRIENTLKLVTPRNDFHHFSIFLAIFPIGN
jgi:hypothetical protein